jgi:MerR family transcriptional regulator, copper efflux regulator
MGACTISRAAELTGFTASALRFYEQEGLVVPDRTSSGYRIYDEHHLDMLRFVRRAKGLGLALDEISTLVPLVGRDRCEPVQARLRDLVRSRIHAAESQAGELVELSRQLRRTIDVLDAHTPDGPCDDACGCTSEPGALRDPVDRPIVCTLGSGQFGDRIAAWHALAATATERHDRPTGVELTFDGAVELARLTDLVAAEHACCAFLTFTITVDAGAIRLAISGPTDGRQVIEALVATAP